LSQTTGKGEKGRQTPTLTARRRGDQKKRGSRRKPGQEKLEKHALSGGGVKVCTRGGVVRQRVKWGRKNILRCRQKGGFWTKRYTREELPSLSSRVRLKSSLGFAKRKRRHPITRKKKRVHSLKDYLLTHERGGRDAGKLDCASFST